MSQETETPEIPEDSKPPEQRRKEALLAHVARMKADPCYEGADPKSALHVAAAFLEKLANGTGISDAIAEGNEKSARKTPSSLGAFIWPEIAKYIPDSVTNSERKAVTALVPTAVVAAVIAAHVLAEGASTVETCEIARTNDRLFKIAGLKSINTSKSRPNLSRAVRDTAYRHG